MLSTGKEKGGESGKQKEWKEKVEIREKQGRKGKKGNMKNGKKRELQRWQIKQEGKLFSIKWNEGGDERKKGNEKILDAI